MSITETRIILENLPYNYLKILSDRTNYSSNYVWLVLRGKRKNAKIMAAAVALADEHITELSSIKQKIQNLNALSAKSKK